MHWVHVPFLGYDTGGKLDLVEAEGAFRTVASCSG